MRILVTGAAGYIGAALVRALPPGEVLATDQSGAAGIGNIAYPQFARSLVTAQTEVVFHLAALVSGGRSLRLPTVMVRPGTANTAVSGWASAIIRELLAGRDPLGTRRETRIPSQQQHRGDRR